MTLKNYALYSYDVTQKFWNFFRFDNVRIPKENLLNSIVDVSPDGEYLSAIKDPDQRFAAFMAALTSGRVNIASAAMDAGNPEKLNELLEINILLLLDWLINSYKDTSVQQNHSCYFKCIQGYFYLAQSANTTGMPWSMWRTRLKTENHVGHLKSEFDVQSTFEGDNNVLMQQVNVYGHLSHKL
ncbi:hypothetical protein Pint_14470 [Pistacia integerrima]|uniref:Uncharacterized protein n=1 Tax=Pistacia integerrima TaxID=434235 RepID=A0ACC0Y7M4_9ROSI|nr:hypothetical protein Pint_14470 [Pistacia integerrima]